MMGGRTRRIESRARSHSTQTPAPRRAGPSPARFYVSGGQSRDPCGHCMLPMAGEIHSNTTLCVKVQHLSHEKGGGITRAGVKRTNGRTLKSPSGLLWYTRSIWIR
jgi:hypothetical protein